MYICSMYSDFDEYLRQGEPDRVDKTKHWQTAIGLQEVDGLKPSLYLIETAKQNIEGDITFDEVKKRIDAYYKTQENRQSETDDRTEEADKVATRIAEILSENTFTFSPAEYLGIHRRLFAGVYKFAGEIRNYNITKSEGVLDGETVLYGGADNLKESLEYDFSQEKIFNYSGLTQGQFIEHIAYFISYIWQIHVFGEGNTRTTAVFLIKYLRTLGFKNINNDLFIKHSWYFRNALVRANYMNLAQNVHKTTIYLIAFLENLIFRENNVLKNRELHVHFGKNTVSADTVNDTVNDHILNSMKESPNITAKEIASNLAISIATVRRRIKTLKDGGLIERVGADKTGRWKVTGKGRS